MKGTYELKKKFYMFAEFGSVMAPSILWETRRTQHSTQVHSYHTVSCFYHVSRMFYKPSEGTALELAVWHTVCHSIQKSQWSGHMCVLYYLHWVCITASGSVRESTTSSREGPQDSGLPAAAAAARSLLLSAAITGASVPIKTISVVQPSEQPLPLPELLPSSPAARIACIKIYMQMISSPLSTNLVYGKSLQPWTAIFFSVLPLNKIHKNI